MPKALDLHFAPRAEKDIDRIYDYTEDEWGTEQAEKYVGEIRRACELLVEVPRTGRSVKHIRPGYFIVSCGSHTSSSAKKRLASSSPAFCINGWISNGISSRDAR